MKENIYAWQEDLFQQSHAPEMFNIELESVTCDIKTTRLSPETAKVEFTTAGYIAKKLNKRVLRLSCELIQQFTDTVYLNHLFRGGLTIPSSSLADFVCKDSAIMDFNDDFVQKQVPISVFARDGAVCMLHQYLAHYNFFCSDHFS